MPARHLMNTKREVPFFVRTAATIGYHYALVDGVIVFENSCLPSDISDRYVYILINSVHMFSSRRVYPHRLYGEKYGASTVKNKHQVTDSPLTRLCTVIYQGLRVLNIALK